MFYFFIVHHLAPEETEELKHKEDSRLECSTNTKILGILYRVLEPPCEIDTGLCPDCNDQDKEDMLRHATGEMIERTENVYPEVKALWMRRLVTTMNSQGLSCEK